MKQSRKQKIGDYATCNNCNNDFDLRYHYSRDMKMIKECVAKGHSVHREMVSHIEYTP